MLDEIAEEVENLISDRQALEASRMELQELGHRYRDASQDLARIKPIYEKMYRSWWYWWTKPLDPYIDGKWYLRCKTCNKLFLKGGVREFTEHRGHMYGPNRHASWFEYIRMRWGHVQ